MEATELGAAHGQVRPDHAWKIRLQRLMNSTPLAATALDPAERTHVEKSGFPDSVVLVQISEAEEDKEVASASISKKSKAGAASSSSTVLMVRSDDSDDEPLTKKPKSVIPTTKPPKSTRTKKLFHGNDAWGRR